MCPAVVGHRTIAIICHCGAVIQAQTFNVSTVLCYSSKKDKKKNKQTRKAT